VFCLWGLGSCPLAIIPGEGMASRQYCNGFQMMFLISTANGLATAATSQSASRYFLQMCRNTQHFFFLFLVVNCVMHAHICPRAHSRLQPNVLGGVIVFGLGARPDGRRAGAASPLPIS